jgi:hypothetical protein
MRELALHILDLVQNSIEAGAQRVVLEVLEKKTVDTLVIRVEDDGRGMDEQMQQRVIDPFVTMRRTRKVGLGLPLIDMNTRHCDGFLKIQSALGCGTVIEATFRHSHLDRPPLGNMTETVKSIIIANPGLDFTYCHTVDNLTFTVSTKELKEILGDIPFTHSDVIIWLTEYLTGHVMNLYGGI